MNLSIFVIVPLLMLLGLWLARNDKQVRGVVRQCQPTKLRCSSPTVCLGLNHCTSTIHSVWMVSQW